MDGAGERIAARLASVRAHVVSLERRLADFVETSAWTTNDDEHDPEGATIAFERAQTAALLRQAREELAALDAAAARVRDGAYGVCVRCGGPIAEGRLEALPAATTCIACAD